MQAMSGNLNGLETAALSLFGPKKEESLLWNRIWTVTVHGRFGSEEHLVEFSLAKPESA